MRSRSAYQLQPSRQRLRSTMDTAPSDCRRTCSRRSETSSARTRTRESTSRAASSSTPTGQAAEAEFPHRRTTLSCLVKMDEPVSWARNWLIHNLRTRYARKSQVGSEISLVALVMDSLPRIPRVDADDEHGHHG